MAQRLKTDWVLFWTTVVMVCFGLVIVYSASSMMAELKFHSSYYFLARQGVFAVVSFGILMLCKRMDYRRFCSPAWAFTPLAVVLCMLVVVYFTDSRRHRWINLGGVSLQPSEFAKPALIIFLAYFITHRKLLVNDRHTLRPALLALGVLALTVVGPDLGTAVILVLTAAVLFYVAGLESRYIVIAAVVCAVLGLVAVASKPYRVARVISHIDPGYVWTEKINPGGQIRSYLSRSLTTTDPAYQPKQSRIAVGSGGVFGVGLMQGKQKLLYLPEAHTDYIYAVIGEELGLWGSTGVLIGFFIILWRGVRLFWTAPDDFGRYLALGITVAIVMQALINMCVVLGIGPTKGFPLPMISYGGSSLLSTLACLGLLLSVSEHSG